MEQGETRGCLKTGLVNTYRYPRKKRRKVGDGTKAIVRQWNTKEKNRVKIIEKKSELSPENNKMNLKMLSSKEIEVDHMNSSTTNKEYKAVKEDEGVSYVRKCSQVDDDMEEIESQILSDLATPSLAANTPGHRGRGKKETKSLSLAACAVWVFMCVLVVTMVGTMSLVQTEPGHGQLGPQLEPGDGDKPVILLSTKFKVPATNTFDEFSGEERMKNFKVERSRNKFAKAGD